MPVKHIFYQKLVSYWIKITAHAFLFFSVSLKYHMYLTRFYTTQKMLNCVIIYWIVRFLLQKKTIKSCGVFGWVRFKVQSLSDYEVTEYFWIPHAYDTECLCLCCGQWAKVSWTSLYTLKDTLHVFCPWFMLLC